MNDRRVFIDKREIYDYRCSDDMYHQVWNVLIGLGFDAKQPFKNMISPGQTAVIKPNFVKGNHPLGKAGVLSMITHAAVMRPLIDALLVSTNNECRIIICDCPLQSSVWEEIIEYSGVGKLVEEYRVRGIAIELLDLRREISSLNSELIIDKRDIRDRDPLGYVRVDLGRRSAFMPVIDKHERFMITDYDRGTVGEHHTSEKNEYCICKTILQADFLINVPKLKTHRKAGITVAGKNMIGINGDKRWIAHHTEGSVAHGGDEFPRLVFRDWFQFRFFSYLKRYQGWGVFSATYIRKVHRWLYYCKRSVRALIFRAYTFLFFRRNNHSHETRDEAYIFFKQRYPDVTRETYNALYPFEGPIMEGSWYGNDTLWRTIHDLNHIIFYADKDGVLRDSRQRKYLCIVDGIVGGEREGPLDHVPREAGIIIGGFHPCAVDYASAYIMGYDYRAIPSVARLMDTSFINDIGITPDTIEIMSNVQWRDINLHFYPPLHWKGHIERDTI